jgi:hypothetical protein
MSGLAQAPPRGASVRTERATAPWAVLLYSVIDSAGLPCLTPSPDEATGASDAR